MINPDTYYTVQGWMISELGLKGNALAAYAIIYGFSQDGVTEYAGSSRYLCEWLGCSKKTALTTLAQLTERGLLKKRVMYNNGVTFCNYTAVRRPPNIDYFTDDEAADTGEEITPGGGVKITPPEENLPRGGVKTSGGWCNNFPAPGVNITPHNSSLHNIDHNIDINTVCDTGVSPTPPAEEKPKKKAGRKKKDEKPETPKKEYGEYKHVKLTDEEHGKLLALYGEHKVAALITFLDEYMEEKPKYKSNCHYLAIRRWVANAVAEREQRNAPRYQTGRNRQGQNVGPNGIVIDPTKNDLADAFK